MPRTATRHANRRATGQATRRATGQATGPLERPELPDQVMLPLLDRIVRQSLDEDYQVAAARRSEGATTPQGRRFRQGEPGRSGHPAPHAHPGRPRQVAAAVMAVFGVLVAIAAVQTSRNAPEANASRASLIEQVEARRDTVAARQERLERLRTSTTELRAALAQAQEDGQALAARIERLGVRTGLAPVSGPGLRITVDDARDGDATQEVRDSDLATLVNGLWNAGAEAMSVNGKRLTSLTAFDNVGPAVHIGITPLVPPYTLLVVGDPDTLAADLLESSFGQRWYSLVDTLGFDFVTERESVELPAARPRLRTVRLLTEQDPNRPAEEDPVSAP